MILFPPKLPFSIALALIILTNKGYAVNRYPSDGVYEEMVGLRRCEPQCLEEQVDELQPDRSTSKMLSAIFGFSPTTPHPMEASPRALPHQLPPMYYNDFYEDLLATKRNDVHSAGCDCKVTVCLLDTGKA